MTGVSISSHTRGGATNVIGGEIVVQVAFSYAVTVTGPPPLALSVRSETRDGGFVRLSGSTLLFRYRVQDGDRDDDGIGIAAGALAASTRGFADQPIRTLRRPGSLLREAWPLSIHTRRSAETGQGLPRVARGEGRGGLHAAV